MTLYDWTSGHPYLTQKLCLNIAQYRNPWDNQRIDQLVEDSFDKEAIASDRHLQAVQNFIKNHPLCHQLLSLYTQVYQEKTVPDEPQSKIHQQLKLSGLVKAGNGKLSISNRIYERVFDLAWVKQQPCFKKEWKIMMGALMMMAILIVFAASSYAWNSSVPNGTQATSSNNATPSITITSTVSPPVIAEVPTTTETETPIPTVTPTQTATPTVTPTQTAMPTVTPTQTATPTPMPTITPTPIPYSSPVLVVPKANASISEPTLLEWSWNGVLQADEYFDVRVWREGEPANGIAWTKDRSYEFDPRSKASGNYFWNIVVIHGQDSKMLSELSQMATPRRLNINREEEASTDKPTPVLLP